MELEKNADVGKFLSDKDKMHVLYKECTEGKKMLLGEKDDNGIDWTMFDFIIASIHPDEIEQNKSPLDDMKSFWTKFFPFLNHLIDDWELIGRNHADSIKEQDDMLREYCKVSEEYKWRKKWINSSGKRIGVFEAWRQRQEEAIQKKIKRAEIIKSMTEKRRLKTKS